MALTIRKAGGVQQDYLVFTFKLVFVAYYGQSFGFQSSAAPDSFINWGDADPTGATPLDHFSMAYGAMMIQYKEQQPDGSLGGEHAKFSRLAKLLRARHGATVDATKKAMTAIDTPHHFPWSSRQIHSARSTR
jgi:type VI protein secretion system component Hcp